MKKIILICIAFLALSGSLFAQNPPERVLFDPEYRGQTVDQNPYYYFEPFGDAVGYSLYGSRYRRAKSNRFWGIALTTVVAPLSGLFAIEAFMEDTPGLGLAQAGICLGSLGVGIPLWSRGRRELDWMMDDYVRRYGPRPYSMNLSVGPTRSGMGLALNF